MFFAELIYGVLGVLILLAVFYISYIVTTILNSGTPRSSSDFLLGDSNDERHGGELVARVLKDHGVEVLFTLTGGHISPILVAAERNKIKVVDTRHEVTAVFAADAYSRLSGKIGVAAVTAGPGLTNTVTAVKNAQMAGSSVLVLSGAAAIALKGRGALQDMDQISLMKSLCKYTVSVSRVKDIIPCICKAIEKAKSGAPGPVFVELPLDVLYPYSIVSKEVQAKQNPRNLVGKVINWYTQFYLGRLFADAFVKQNTFPSPIHVSKATESEIHSCLKLLSNSKKPLLLLGSQVTYPANECHQVCDAVKDLKIPCFVSGMARGMLGKSHPLLFRQKRSEALREADLIILAGVTCDFRLSYGRSLSKSAKVIAINLDKDLLFKNNRIFWNCTIAINGSVSDFLVRLAAAALEKSSFQHECLHKSWVDTLQEREKEAEERIIKKSKEETVEHLNPVSMLLSLEKHITDKTILIADGGDFVATASYILRPVGPLMWLDPGPFGTLGVGAGFAIGAKICCPDADVVIIYGDGSLGYSIMEFDTFVRHNLPVMAVVGNDACWGQIEREQVPMFNSDVACRLRFLDYDRVAEALGGIGMKITGSDKDSLDDILSSAFQNYRKNKNVLLNVLIGKTDFRSGSISV